MNKDKPFYKIWWFWLIVVILVVIIFGMFGSGGSSNDDSSSNVKQTNTSNTTKDADDSNSAKSKSKTIDLDNDEATIIKEINYDPNYTDNSWAGTNVNIDRVKVATIKPFKDEEEKNNIYKGIVIVHFNVEASRDIDFYPTQGTLVTSDGQQVDANSYSSDNFDGEIAKGAKKSGNVLFTLTTLNNPKDLKNIRLKWDADYQTDDLDDDASNKTYDITINLN
ncbi:hypothetical protein [Companilactobacillus nantensis]|uniref:Prophage related protein n=1 Tax=Companilactobacillus nantensis DSM 16982 TaxID=1423774 RepID=A0A0R1WCJ0_9LACO|nr:hypothetical protein [Companilactobacillus nantensis]KRM15559.1 prophage related protein [Companilactobacillus nantensis DSM 16982]GEO64660.1 hypothetical protein LNA01_18430 [Companilactobacillus nantensis]